MVTVPVHVVVKKKTDGSESSDDEPLIKKTKKSPPTDDDIVDLVKDLLDGADLEKITMKSVCKQVRMQHSFSTTTTTEC